MINWLKNKILFKKAAKNFDDMDLQEKAKWAYENKYDLDDLIDCGIIICLLLIAVSLAWWLVM